MGTVHGVLAVEELQGEITRVPELLLGVSDILYVYRRETKDPDIAAILPPPLTGGSWLDRVTERDCRELLQGTEWRGSCLLSWNWDRIDANAKSRGWDRSAGDHEPAQTTGLFDQWVPQENKGDVDVAPLPPGDSVFDNTNSGERQQTFDPLGMGAFDDYDAWGSGSSDNDEMAYRIFPGGGFKIIG
jgi:hypothetical protein